MRKYIKNRERVVSEPIEHDNWKGVYLIPGFSKYGVTRRGEVIELAYGKKHHQSKSKTSKGSYLTVTLLSDYGRITVGVHILVCLTFHGLPAEGEDQVNHDDGDKHNNAASNVYWTTKSGNLIHAYDSGLRTENRPVLVKDVSTNSVTRFRSITHLEKTLLLPKGKGKLVIRDHTKTPYAGKYTFEYDPTHKTVPNDYSWRKGVICYSLKSDEAIIANSLSEAELVTGVYANTIQYLAQRESDNPHKGHVFRYTDSTKPFPTYSEEMKELVRQWDTVTKPLSTTAVNSNTTQLWPSLKVALENLHIAKNGALRLFGETGYCEYRGYIFEALSNPIVPSIRNDSR